VKLVPHNLPIQLTSFIGRERAMVEVKRWLAKTRLLTLTGTAGCGKTRLALEVAARRVADFEEGIWLAELASISDESLVPRAVASALGISEKPGRALTETLADELKPKTLLLLLDNCEHLVSACAQLAETLLRTCPHLKILTTSRETLRVTGEAVWTVPPLSVPDLPRMVNGLARTRGKALVSALLAYESVRLFVERASATLPDFRVTPENAIVIAHICQRLDGIPLAIELAAARVRTLPLIDLTERLDDRFRLLIGSSRTAVPRHQTLLAAIDWSYALLSENEQAVLRRLSVFAGGWTLEAAEAVSARGEVAKGDILDTLSQLIDKSLVIMREQAGKARYGMLETIRQYAWERLVDSGEATVIRRQHAEYFLALAQESGAKLWGAEQLTSAERLEAEHDNLRAALAWSRSEPAGTEIGLRLAATLTQFWQLRGYPREGLAWLEALLSKGGEVSAAVRAYALERAGFLSMFLNKQDQATAFFEEALALYRELDDTRGITTQLYSLAWMAQLQGNYSQAVTLAHQSLMLAREQGDKWSQAAALYNLGEVAYLQGDLVQAKALFEESLALSREMGNLWAVGVRLTRLGQIVHAQGDSQRALVLMKESLVAGWQARHPLGIAEALTALAGMARAQGEPARAVRLLAAVTAVREATGTVMMPNYEQEYEREVAIVRTQLDTHTFESAWKEGQAMTIEQVMAYVGVTPPAHLEEVSTPSLTPAQAAKQAYEGLTRREREVAALVAQGKSNREIATKLVVDIKTVEAHISRILNKLDLTSRTQIALWARNKGLG
jgi:predicted ATPase/DNA-binding NarL/FixJ family response regulator